MLEPALQAAGHPGSHRGQGLFIKPSTRSEISFYQAMEDRGLDLRFLTPRYMGTLTPGTADVSAVNPEACKGIAEANPLPSLDSVSYIVLEDLLQTFYEPCIMDIKLGSILWADDAAEEKIKRLKAVSETTTSGSLHFRIAGMTTIDPVTRERKVFDKEYGRGFKGSDVKTGLLEYLPDDYDKRTYVGVAVVTFLRELAKSLSKSGADLRSSSLLIVYEHDSARAKEHFKSMTTRRRRKGGVLDENSDASDDDEEWSSDSDGYQSGVSETGSLGSGDSHAGQGENVECRLIDFNHAEFKDVPCHDVLLGLTNLEKLLIELCDLEDLDSTGSE